MANKVVSPDELLDAAKTMAEKIMKQAPYAVQLCKEAVNVGIEVDQDTGTSYEGTLFGVTCATDDKKEGMTAFVEKRKPNFVGK